MIETFLFVVCRNNAMINMHVQTPNRVKHGV